MSKNIKQIAMILLIGLIVLTIFKLNQPDVDHKELDYSDFLQKVKDNQVSRVTIKNNKKILGLFRDNRFVEKEKLKGKCSSLILNRLIEYDSQPAFCLYFDAETGNSKVFLTQRDIRQIQLAKAAIRTGIKLLQKKLSVDDQQIQNVMLAGAFGNYIRKESALRIGLLPKVPLERIHFVGNAAGSGAELILLSKTARTDARKLARRIEVQAFMESVRRIFSSAK